MPKPAVIVLNSHVARGGVGGRASVFVLERMGFPVWSVPTVTVPWHLGHGRATRIGADAAAFKGLLADLAGARWLGEVGAVLSGYLGAPEQAAPIAGLVAAVKRRTPAALYLCDPIMGDGDRLYVPEAVAAAIRDHLVPQADILTPNSFELGWLVGRPLADNEAIVAAARSLGPREVMVTSSFSAPHEIAALVVTPDAVHGVTHRRLAEVPHGTGDLFAALYLAHRLEQRSPPDALQRATSTVLALVELAEKTGADEMPLTSGQGAFAAEPAGVTVSRLA